MSVQLETERLGKRLYVHLDYRSDYIDQSPSGVRNFVGYNGVLPRNTLEAVAPFQRQVLEHWEL